MIINLTSTDLWNEFIFWRKMGQPRAAFEYIRRSVNPDDLIMMLALIVKRKYGDAVTYGDTVTLENSITFWWDKSIEEAFYDPSLSSDFAEAVHIA
jgi:hypothetical protein